MKRLLPVALLAGCATISTPEGFALCKAADVTTTVLAVQAGRREQNPLFAEQTNRGNYLPIAAAGVLMYYVVRKINDPNFTATAAGLTCAVAANNLLTRHK